MDDSVLDEACSAATRRRGSIPRVARRASINIASLSSAHPPVFGAELGSASQDYSGHLADDLIRNQDHYYRHRADVRIPALHDRELSKGTDRHRRPTHAVIAASSSSSATSIAALSPQPLSPRRLQPSQKHQQDNQEQDNHPRLQNLDSQKSSSQQNKKRIPPKRLNMRPSGNAADQYDDDDHAEYSSEDEEVKYDLTFSAEWSHLLAIMKKMKGVIRGWAKWKTQSARGSGYCYTEEFSGALLFEQKESVAILINDLRGCTVSLSPVSSTAIQVISARDPSSFAIIELDSAEEFNKWLAVLISWSPLRAAGVSSRLLRFRYPQLDLSVRSGDKQQPSTAQKSSAKPAPAPAPAQTPIDDDHKTPPEIKDQQPVVRTIKVGQLELWDPQWRQPPPPPPASSAAQKRTKQSSASSSSTTTTSAPSSAMSSSNKLWVKASCLLKTNGDFQIFPELPLSSRPRQQSPAIADTKSSSSASSSKAQINSNSHSQSSAASLSSSSSSSGSATPSFTPSTPYTGTTSRSFLNNTSSHYTLQLSTIRRSAIQKADPSLTGRQNCIVIFLKTTVSKSNPTPAVDPSQQSQGQQPQSPTSQQHANPSLAFSVHHHHNYHRHQSPAVTSPPENQPNQVAPTPGVQTPGTTVLVTPVYFFFESRTLMEVWFVLFRSMSLPELYGPDTGRVSGSFRQIRTLNIRIIDGKILWPRGPGLSVDSTFMPKAIDSYVDIELNDKVRARTRVKYGTAKPFWREDFSFPDLPFLVNSVKLKLRSRNRKNPDLLSDATIGEVKLLMSDVQQDSDLERWIPVFNPARGYTGKTGELCVKMQISEYTILAGREYDRLLELLLDFSNRLTLTIADMTGDMKQLSTILLDIFQSSGQATEWLISLAEEEIWERGNYTGPSRQTPPPTKPAPTSDVISTRPAVPLSDANAETVFSTVGMSRVSSQERDTNSSSGASTLSPGTLSPPESSRSRADLLRDVSPSRNEPMAPRTAAIADANLLFRGNSLLTKSLDAHMRRIGQDYLIETLGSTLQKIVDDDVFIEVDPQKIEPQHQRQSGNNTASLEENWARLEAYLVAIWTKIRESKSKCPPALRRIFHNIRLHIEEKYGEFLSAASYTGVSGFLFLRFFCPAVLNPHLFGLVRDHPGPRSQRTLVLIAKGLQGLANRTTFGAKEPWMAPMNAFLQQRIEEFKEFIVDVSTWRTRVYPAANADHHVVSSPDADGGNDYLDDNEIEATQRSLFMVPYQIPNTVLSRLPTAFRDGVPSLPYLIDRPATLAALVELWLQWYDAKVSAKAAQRAAAAANAKRNDSSDDYGDEIDDRKAAERRSRDKDRASLIESLPDTYTDESDVAVSEDEGDGDGGVGFSSSSSSVLSSDSEEEEEGPGFFSDDDALADLVDEDEEDDKASHKHHHRRHHTRPGLRRRRVFHDGEDTPSGILFTGALVEFHHECIRIREEIRRLRNKTTIPEMPSDVPEETWDYYVANFLNIKDFKFSKRGNILKSLLMTTASGSVKTSGDSSSGRSSGLEPSSTASTDSHWFGEQTSPPLHRSTERTEDDYSYFSYPAASEPAPSAATTQMTSIHATLSPVEIPNQKRHSSISRTSSTFNRHSRDLSVIDSASRSIDSTISAGSSSTNATLNIGGVSLGTTSTATTDSVSSEVSLREISSSVSRGFGTLSKKSKSIKLQSWRKFLGGGSSTSNSGH
ncbi:hypothetical protein BZA70DRAFT_291488 [Myxozyma melibiosi]|uniref:Ras-GAP domain-containing protein n=1 Tax=Myxozyma melibiosi TaxID=54550 RepID=A0ABR1F1Q1_9ASCO